jgi:phosphotransferase system IIA component
MTNYLPTEQAEWVIKTGGPDMVHVLVSSYSLSGPLIRMALKRKDLTKHTRLLLKRDLEALKQQNREEI